MSWFFSDEKNSYVEDVARGLIRGDAWVPPLWHIEVANTLLVGERRKRCTYDDVVQWIAYIVAFPIQVDELHGASVFGNVISLARAYGLSSYDAMYLELAQRRELPLATLDLRLRKAAKAAGISLYLS